MREKKSQAVACKIGGYTNESTRPYMRFAASIKGQARYILELNAEA